MHFAGEALQEVQIEGQPHMSQLQGGWSLLFFMLQL